jgi:hypothetical protein
MSTGENINANGSVLTAEMVRGAFHRFPQSEIAWVSREQWPQIAPILFMQGVPFRAGQNEAVPAGEVWLVGTTGELLGRIVNIGNPT